MAWNKKWWLLLSTQNVSWVALLIWSKLRCNLRLHLCLWSGDILAGERLVQDGLICKPCRAGCQGNGNGVSGLWLSSHSRLAWGLFMVTGQGLTRASGSLLRPRFVTGTLYSCCFYWSTQVTKPAKIQGKEELTPHFAGRRCKITKAAYIQEGGITGTIFVITA